MWQFRLTGVLKGEAGKGSGFIFGTITLEIAEPLFIRWESTEEIQENEDRIKSESKLSGIFKSEPGLDLDFKSLGKWGIDWIFQSILLAGFQAQNLDWILDFLTTMQGTHLETSWNSGEK